MVSVQHDDQHFLATAVELGLLVEEQAHALLRQRAAQGPAERVPIAEWVLQIGALDAAPGRPATVLGGYRIVTKVGEGGMGARYKAFDPELEKHFALKVISRDKSRRPQFLERFQVEARLASRVDDPHTVPILKFGQDRGLYYCVMPFVDGVDVGDVVVDAVGDVEQRSARREPTLAD